MIVILLVTCISLLLLGFFILIPFKLNQTFIVNESKNVSESKNPNASKNHTISKNSTSTNITLAFPINSNSNEKYLVIGSRVFSGGIGNTLIYYPAAFFFAILTNREIIIHDESDIDLMCKFITCKFRRLSQVSQVSDLISSSARKNQRKSYNVTSLKHFDLLNHFKMIEIEQQFIKSTTFVSKSDWILQFESSNGTASTIANVSQCALADITCAERFALRSLFVGPFLPALPTNVPESLQLPEESEILQLERDMSENAWDDVPRIDAAIHLRNQFRQFENKSAIGDHMYREEVSSWLASPFKMIVFSSLAKKLEEELTSITAVCLGNASAFTVYISGDNDEVKYALKEFLQVTVLLPIPMVILMSRSSSEGVLHLGKAPHLHSPNVMQKLAFDWYALTLSNVLLGWRQGSISPSTFLHSAMKMGIAKCRGEDGGNDNMRGVRGFSLEHKASQWNRLFQYADRQKEKDALVAAAMRAINPRRKQWPKNVNGGK